jgi:signal transduction histidine kinase
MDNLEQQKLDALAEFAAGAGHEINNPLAIIGGRAQLLLREIDHPEHRRQLGVIVAQVKRAYEMIADIRFFARPPKPELVEFDLIEELQTLVAEQTPLMAEAGVTFYVESNSVDVPMVKTDPVLLHVAVSVLCNNAREAVQLTNGTVWLRCHRDDHGWEISVEDNGPGVSEEIRPLIFDPYYSGRQAGRGLGFGLPKAWRIMQLLGGSVRHEQGAKFVLTLPDAKSSVLCQEPQVYDGER